MSDFSTFINSSGALDPNAIRSSGFASAPGPEVAGHDEIIQVGELAGASDADVLAYGYGQKPRVWESASLDNSADIAFREGYDNILVGYLPRKAFLWLPSEHEYFVICTAPDLLERIRADELFSYDFKEYSNGDYFQGNKKDFLEGVLREYTISASV